MEQFSRTVMEALSAGGVVGPVGSTVANGVGRGGESTERAKWAKGSLLVRCPSTLNDLSFVRQSFGKGEEWAGQRRPGCGAEVRGTGSREGEELSHAGGELPVGEILGLESIRKV